MPTTREPAIKLGYNSRKHFEFIVVCTRRLQRATTVFRFSNHQYLSINLTFALELAHQLGDYQTHFRIKMLEK